MSPDLHCTFEAAITLTPEQARDIEREVLLLDCLDLLERYDALADRLQATLARREAHVLALVDTCIGELDTYADLHAVAGVNALADFRDRLTGDET